MTEALQDEAKIVQKESIKLTHNSKGYTWEIKVFIEQGDDKTLDRIDKLNTELLNAYGGASNED